MWQDVLKTQESIADTKVGIFKPKEGFELDNDNNEKCCEDARVWIIEEDRREHLSWSYSGDGPSKNQLLEMQPWNALNKKDCEELYDYLTGEIKEYSKYPNSAILMTKQKAFIKIKKEWDECKA